MSEYTITANTSSAELVSILSSLEDDDIVNVDCPEFPRTFTNEITAVCLIQIHGGSSLYYMGTPLFCKKGVSMIPLNSYEIDRKIEE